MSASFQSPPALDADAPVCAPVSADAPPGLQAPLDAWLTHVERIHPRTIDLGLDRVRAVAQRMGLGQRLGVPVVTVAGTNGKGSTCAMLASIYGAAGYRTGLYTSPHLVRFNERCRIDGEPVDDAALVGALARVEQARVGDGTAAQPAVSLSYFEFTTLAILWLLDRAGLDVLILEVGLGGRLDAVNLVDADCAVVTSVDIDHAEWLGPDREHIGREKAGIMRAATPVVVSDPSPPQSVLAHAKHVGADVWLSGVDFGFEGDKQQWGWSATAARGGRRYAGLAYPALRGANQLVNASGVLAVLEVLRSQLPVTAQAIRVGLSLVDWPGRFQIVPGQPALVLDVAHNPHATAALVMNLDAMGFFPKTHVVFGAMADKDLAPMLARVAPLVDHWHFTDLPSPRAASAQALAALWTDLSGAKGQLAGCHANPQAALDAAVASADPADRIVVFGSFFTVGGVLLHGTPRLSAKHLVS